MPLPARSASMRARSHPTRPCSRSDRGRSPAPPWSLNLSPAGDLEEAAANLFAMLRALDRPGIRTIAVMPIPREDLGEAIRDRLARAAAPRPAQPRAGDSGRSRRSD